jgi:hypothetical protein
MVCKHRVVDESILDTWPAVLLVAEAADAGAVSAGFLGESDAFLVGSYWGAGSDEGDLEDESLGAALVLFDAAGSGLGLGGFWGLTWCWTWWCWYWYFRISA